MQASGKICRKPASVTCLVMYKIWAQWTWWKWMAHQKNIDTLAWDHLQLLNPTVSRVACCDFLRPRPNIQGWNTGGRQTIAICYHDDPCTNATCHKIMLAKFLGSCVNTPTNSSSINCSATEGGIQLASENCNWQLKMRLRQLKMRLSKWCSKLTLERNESE